MEGGQIPEELQSQEMSWAAKLFADNDQEVDSNIDLYIGEDEDEIEETDWFQEHMDDDEKQPSHGPKIYLTRGKDETV